MASNKSDIGFAFDPAPFVNGLKKMDSGLDNLTKHVVKSTKDMGKGFAWAMAKGQLMANALMGLGKGFVNVINKQIPEIGQSFSIAKDIIFKNLFWPIRQTLVPMLQKMLNWVRDNRGMFLKWGQVINNVFLAGVKVAGIFWNALKGVWNAIAPILGAAKGGLGDAINLIVGKIAVVAQYIVTLLSPVMNFLKDLVGKVAASGIIQTFIDLAMAVGKVAWDGLTGFLAGITGSGAIESILGNLNKLGQGFKSLFNSWTDKKNGVTLFSVFEKVGHAVGEIAKFFGSLAEAFGTGLASNLKTIMGPLQSIFDSVDRLFKSLNNGGKATFLTDLFGGLGKALGAGLTTGLNAVALALNGIVSTILTLSSMGPVIADIFGGKWADIGKHFTDALGNMKGLGSAFNQAFSQSSQAWGNVLQPTPGPDQKVKDGVVQGGKAVSTDPKDVIIAHKGNVSVNKDSSGIGGQGTWTVNLTVTEGSATQAGKNFADGLQYKMRSLLAHEAMIGGR